MERYQDLKSELIDWLWEQAEEVRQGTITPEHLTQLQELEGWEQFYTKHCLLMEHWESTKEEGCLCEPSHHFIGVSKVNPSCPVHEEDEAMEQRRTRHYQEHHVLDIISLVRQRGETDEPLETLDGERLRDLLRAQHEHLIEVPPERLVQLATNFLLLARSTNTPQRQDQIVFLGEDSIFYIMKEEEAGKQTA